MQTLLIGIDIDRRGALISQKKMLVKGERPNSRFNFFRLSYELLADTHHDIFLHKFLVKPHTYFKTIEDL